MAAQTLRPHAQSSSSGSVLDCIGNTPLLHLKMEHEGRHFAFYAKCEFMNPSGSVKDRIAKYIIEKAEREGRLKKDAIIVEATSGNTGIGLAMVAAVKGYRLLIVMPEHMSIERRKIMQNLGAEILLTPIAEGFSGSREKTLVLAEKDNRVFLTRQFQNPDNIECHYETTGREILEQTGEQKIDAFVAGVGTGGTLMGVGRRLKEINPSCKIIAVEPQESAVLTGNGGFAPHKIHGIGDGFIPELLDVTQVDWTETIKSDNAVAMAKVLCLKYGLMVGISAGANVLAVFNVLQKLGENAGVITILPDRSERYFSTDLFKCKDEKECLKCTRNIESVFCEHR